MPPCRCARALIAGDGRGVATRGPGVLPSAFATRAHEGDGIGDYASTQRRFIECTDRTTVWLSLSGVFQAHDFTTSILDHSRTFNPQVHGGGRGAAVPGRMFLTDPGEQRIVMYDIP